ncbi:MAG: hypothetical protein OEZ23_02825, partial [Gammaproteobacteria bacterium]|nr:hypothetical protein [Gammaproteobacteria bacterium]
MIDITEQHLPRDAGDRKVWDQLAGSAAALAVAGALGVNPGRSALIVTPDTRTADMFHQELLFFLEETQKRVAM